MTEDSGNKPVPDIQHMLAALCDDVEDFVWGTFAPHFVHHDVLDSLTYYAKPGSEVVEYIPGTNMAVLRDGVTGEIIGFRVEQYSKIETMTVHGSPQ